MPAGLFLLVCQQVVIPKPWGNRRFSFQPISFCQRQGALVFWVDGQGAFQPAPSFGNLHSGCRIPGVPADFFSRIAGVSQIFFHLGLPVPDRVGLLLFPQPLQGLGQVKEYFTVSWAPPQRLGEIFFRLGWMVGVQFQPAQFQPGLATLGGAPDGFLQAGPRFVLTVQIPEAAPLDEGNIRSGRCKHCQPI